VSAIWSPIPVAASPDPYLRSAAEYCALITSFSERKASTRVESCLLARDELLLLRLELLDLPVETLELLLNRGLALERLPGEILAPLPERLACLRVEFDDVLLEGPASEA